MSLATVFLIALGLSADAFAVSLARGAAGRVGGPVSALSTGLVFGASEATMSLLGYGLASRFAEYVTSLDHWIALLLLGAVGGHMLHQGLVGGSNNHHPRAAGGRGFIGNVVTALGTSVDAAAVGVAFAFINVDIWSAAALIGAVSFSMSTSGLLIGPRVGRYLGHRVEVAGGLVLIAIGAHIFLSHTT